jgi:U3 small nucleolar RNA-associated protein MPP10
MEDMKDAKEDDVAVPGRKNDKKKNLTKEEEKLRRQTDELEKELINEKPWQMKGESKSTSRPTNSLLEGTPEFEMASKQAPIITVEHTIDLEDAIKKRIIAEDWDDVVPRELPDIGWNKKRGEAPEVSQEKSKLGLGELYEREYLKKAVGYDKDADEKKTEEDKAKDEMKQLFANLCSKLDALSNYHFAPRPIADEAEARPMTVPAIAMEEVLPLHVSDARGIAPEEVYAPKRGRDGILRADDEMDQTDRKRQRNSKKTARRKARKEKEADNKLISRLQPGLGLNNPYEKRKAQEELSLARARGKVTMGERDMTDTKFGSSGTFFKRLQAEAQETVHGHAKELNDDGPEKKSKSKSSAYKL